MLTSMKHQQGFAHLLALLVVAVILVVGTAGWLVYKRSSHNNTQNSTANNTQNNSLAAQNLAQTTAVDQKPEEPDSADTLSTPEKVVSKDGKTYFTYGAPEGQNNKEIKRIIISLPGHSTTSDKGYEAWKDHISSLNGGTYAIAEFNWWDGEANETANYYNPTDGTTQIRAFLDEHNYTQNDIIVLHGFSRGSANTYAFIANDQKMGNPYFDAVISNSGKYEANFPVFSNGSQPKSDDYTKYYTGIPWILVCGGKDPNIGQSDCTSMEQTKAFLMQHKANVLALLEDPNEAHGAFHMSSLNLPKQAIDLIETALK